MDTEAKEVEVLAREKRAAGYPFAHQVERLVRPKNKTYTKWRKGKSWEDLDTWCTECMFRFGALPEWQEYTRAVSRGDTTLANHIECSLHSPWKRSVVKWAIERRVAPSTMQAYAFIRYYFAWYRWRQERAHGPIKGFGRQMRI